MSQQARARVAIAHTTEKHRSPERVAKLVREAIDLIGGIKHFIKPGQSVFIKPNQTVFYSAEVGVTTDPLIVEALVRLAKEAGASRVEVGDASGGMFPSMRVMEITGMRAAAERAGAKVVDLKKSPNRKVSIPNAQFLHEAEIPSALLDADVIIDVPKAKTHENEALSCACKNWVGTQHQEQRRKHHGGSETPHAFMDIMSVTRPALVVVDALICGEGDGPIGNIPRWNGCILASDDPVATDVTVARMMSIDWQKLEYPKSAEAHGLGIRDPDRIDILGTKLEDVTFEAWTGHHGFDYFPFNFIVGEGVEMPGTIGHVKSILDSWIKMGFVEKIMFLKGTPTFLIGKAEDPHFEEHLKEGPYIVIDDAALDKYKNDPRTHFVAGHPVTDKMLPGVLESLGVKLPGEAMMHWQQFQRWGMNNLEYGSPARKAYTVAMPLGVIALISAAAYALYKQTAD